MRFCTLLKCRYISATGGAPVAHYENREMRGEGYSKLLEFSQGLISFLGSFEWHLII